MGAAGDLRANQCGFGVEGIGIDFFQRFTADIIIAIAGRGRKALRADTVFLHGGHDLGLVKLRYLINGGKTGLQLILRRTAELENCAADAHFVINLLCIHCCYSLFSFILLGRIDFA